MSVRDTVQFDYDFILYYYTLLVAIFFGFCIPVPGNIQVRHLHPTGEHDLSLRRYGFLSPYTGNRPCFSSTSVYWLFIWR